MNHANEVNIDPTWQGLIKWGGFSLVIAGIIVIIFIVGVGAFHVTLPLDPAVVLERPGVPTTLFIITIFGEFLLLPGFLALYFTLRQVDKAKMFMAAVLGAFSVVMFFVSRALIISLSQVSAGYKSAATDSGKAAYLAAAEVALETQNVYSTIALIFLSLASILVGIVMLKSDVFRRSLSYVVILSGIFSIFTPFAVNLGIPLVISLIGLFLMLVWQLLAGIKLYKLAKL